MTVHLCSAGMPVSLALMDAVEVGGCARIVQAEGFHCSNRQSKSAQARYCMMAQSQITDTKQAVHPEAGPAQWSWPGKDWKD